MPKSLPKEVTKVQKFKNHKVDYNTENSISFSQFYTYSTCPHQWYLTYVKKLAPYEPSIHALFGTALHETLQSWLEEMYTKTIKSSMDMDLNGLLLERMKSTFKKEKYRNGHESFSDPEEMSIFFSDGKDILEWIKKKRSDYFTRKYTYLVGTEIPIVQEVRPGLYFKGYIDLVFYDDFTKRYKIVDIKTSTSGWNDYAKKDDVKMGQILLYKEFFSQQFDVDIENIDVEFFIVKRKLPYSEEFTPKRVQLHSPSSGKIKRGKIMKMFNEFIDDCFDVNGNIREKSFTKNPSQHNCRFCPFKENKYLCDVSFYNQ